MAQQQSSSKAVGDPSSKANFNLIYAVAEQGRTSE